MRHPCLIPALAICLFASCKKIDDKSESCRLTSTRNGSTIVQVNRSPEGYLYPSISAEPRFFNQGTLAEMLGDSDTVRLDARGRLAYLRLPFSGPSGWQIRTYEYNGDGQVTRTHTNTGTGMDYLTDLVWENGDPISVSYRIAGSTGDRMYTYTYYQDKESPDRYSSWLGLNQVGAVFSRHLLKSRIDPFSDTVYYAYSFDEQGRIKKLYTDRDGSGWGGYKRTVDTTHYRYTCY